jgi:hypothetical protein
MGVLQHRRRNQWLRLALASFGLPLTWLARVVNLLVGVAEGWGGRRGHAYPCAVLPHQLTPVHTKPIFFTGVPSFLQSPNLIHSHTCVCYFLTVLVPALSFSQFKVSFHTLTNECGKISQ